MLGVAAAVALDEGIRLLHNGAGGAVVGLHQQHTPLRVELLEVQQGDVYKRQYEASEAAKREICAALKTLMAQKPLNKITVAEIMQSCGMARQHFYYHFEDIYDAVRWMFDQEAVALLREHEGVMLWQDGLLQLFQYLQENRAVCLCALHSISREQLKRFFQTDVHVIIQGTIQRLSLIHI